MQEKGSDWFAKVWTGKKSPSSTLHLPSRLEDLPGKTLVSRGPGPSLKGPTYRRPACILHPCVAVRFALWTWLLYFACQTS